MGPKQKTIGEIIESERSLVLEAPDRYGDYYNHALDISTLLTAFIESRDEDHFVFGRYYGLLKKHHLLALLSTARLHHVQASMDLRQALEAGLLAAYALANPDPNLFLAKNKDGLTVSSPDLTRKAGQWLQGKHPQLSRNIKDLKDEINETTAHANLVYTDANYVEADEGVSSPFFDIEDVHAIKTELWRIGNIGINLLCLFHVVNQSGKAIAFVDDFQAQLSGLMNRSNVLRAEMMATDQYKEAEAAKAAMKNDGNEP